MKLFICTDHDGHYPVGVASVVVAQDEAMARQLMDVQLLQHGLKPHSESSYTLKEVSLKEPVAMVLNSGDY